MMAAYQPQPGAMHPGMAHPGHPPMTPGQQMNPAQMQQMGHPGVSGPGAPHVTQAGAMMGMQPGANGMGGQHPGGQMGGMPAQMGGQSMAGGTQNPHALSHMTTQAQMQQQQQQMLQQQMQANPQFAMQQHQQQMLRRQQQIQQMHANGMVQQGGMQGMNPQQIQQLQNNQGMQQQQSVQLPPHLHAQQVQVMQQRAQQHQAQQNQQHQAQQMQQQLAMQHANSQHSNQGSQPGPTNQQGQPQHPGQMRPQSRMANPNEQNQGVQQNAQQGQQGQQQPNQQQGQQQNQQQQGQPQGMNPQQMQAMQQRQRMQQQQLMQQTAIQQRMAQAQQTQQQQQTGQFILRLMLLGGQLSDFNSESGKDVENWHQFVDRHWNPEGRFLHTFAEEGKRRKTYEVPRPTIAQYFQMYFDSGAQSIRLHTENARENTAPQNRHQVSFASATFTVFYPNGTRLEMTGTVSVLFAPNVDLIECMELQTTSWEEIISRLEIERLLTNWSPATSSKTSPKMTKNKIPKAQQKMQSQFEGLTIDHFPKTPKGSLGVSARVQHFLEIGETMNLMSDLMSFAQEKRLRAEPAMEAWVAQYQATGGQNGAANEQGNPQINLPPNGVPVGNRTPSMQNMQMPNVQGQFSSPSFSNLGLPMQNGMNGSPHIANNPGLAPNMANMPNSHTPSPHQSNMAAPTMLPQHSQQGTNSSAASTNASPNVNNKRRRTSVKMEGDEGGGEVGVQAVAANRMKPSPRGTKKSKPGGGG